ncbi:MAG: threonine synthase [Beijerinckiaceae bacterium]
MRYISTRGEAPALSFSDAVLAGLARDGGLYLPETWPQLSGETIAGFAGRPFHEVAAAVLTPFIDGEIDASTLSRMTEEAYAGFGHPAVTPLRQIDTDTFVLELFHGPTLAFKDVAMQLLARLMDHILAQRGKRATIVGATSGDTGGAAVEAFRGSERVDVAILYPQGRVSDVQRRMMTTPTEENVRAIAIDGDFDDCQALVKAMFNHQAFRDRVRLSGINSINWGRIVAQATYYFVAAAALGAPHRKMAFSVPTGNFGDIFAGHVAKRMGLPIERLVIATNDNDILARTRDTGIYEMKTVAATTSPSMDIQISSNFERWLFAANGGDAGEVRAQMAALAQGRRFSLSPRQWAEMQATLGAARADEATVATTIRKVSARSGYTVEPHTACGVAALEGQDLPAGVPRVVLATAHPAKFPDAMESITGERPELPTRLSRLMIDPERISHLPNDLRAVERFIENMVGARAGDAA